jgi:hypothetical protein
MMPRSIITYTMKSHCYYRSIEMLVVLSARKKVRNHSKLYMYLVDIYSISADPAINTDLSKDSRL